jgi:acyl transferase domain-containing protein/acyl carrier protein
MSRPAEPTTSAETLKRAYHAIETLQRKVAALERARSEPIAIVGMGCRFPGGAVDPESFWRLLESGTDAIAEVPADRWNVDAYYAGEAPRPGKTTTRWGGFIDHVDHFDSGFFGISRREAVSMDPQQRLVLEVAWEALEHAGLPPARLAGTRGGVFLGACSYDYATLHFSHPLDVSAYASTGTAHSALPGRLSYVLDFKGPSVAVDTACSSSLVAVHLACQSLRAGECDVALSGGVNVILSPLPTIAFSQFGMMATDGRCRTFDASATGFVRGEGCGVVVLKRLSDALAQGDEVLAVVRGTAVNQDGRSTGLTAPNVLSQRDLLRQALEVSGLKPSDISYIEAHGTGTPLGDPIEVEALSEVFGHGNGAKLLLGSVKTNIGHLEAAAGVAGLIKVVLSLRHGAIPPHLHFERLNPHISFDGTPFAVPTKLEPWAAGQARRIAGVSSFGFAGTNAHLIVEEAPARTPAAEDARRPLSVLALSAKSDAALFALARRYRERLVDGWPASIADLCFSAGAGRSHFRHRLAAVGGSTAELRAQLDSFLDVGASSRTVNGDGHDSEVVFLFTGQGAQRSGMARGLYERQPTFRKVLDRCDELLRPTLQKPLLSVLYPEDPTCTALDDTAYTQPALFAVEYALAELWRSWGVKPAAVLGHSLGEYVAACVAGVITLEDGLRFVAERAQLMQALPKTGAMAVVFAPEEEVAGTIAHLQARVSIAAVNGPASTVISGVREAVDAACADLAARGVRAEKLRVSHAFHSPLIEPILEPMRRLAASIACAPPRIPLVSNLTGELWAWDKAPDAEYWCRHARGAVRFTDCVETLHGLGYTRFLEIGPSPTLLGMVKQCPSTRERLLLPSLRPGQDEWRVLLSALAELYTHGADVDWRGFDGDYARSRVQVPTYPFESTRCWYESRHRKGAQDEWQDDAIPADEVDAEDGGVADEELLYEIAWQPAPGAEPAAQEPEAKRTWLVFADGGGVGDGLASRVARRGSRCIRLVPGAAYSFDGRESAVVRLGEAGDLSRLLLDAAIPAGEGLEVVHLWSLRGGERPDSAEGLLRDQDHGCASVARVVQALAKAHRAGPTRLWLVTRGATRPVPEPSAPLAIGASTLWGLGRSLQREHPELWGGLVDLDPAAAPQEQAAELTSALEQRDGEDQVAIRHGVRHAARLVRRTATASHAEAARWRKDASYLITGGLGDLGLAVARSMVLGGARRLVLVGRKPMPPRSAWADLAAADPTARRVAAVRELEALGASVILESLDVAEERDVRAFLERFDRQGWPAIRGVVHAAGMVEVRPMVDLEPADLERHLRPKLAGAWNLHRLLGDRPLDFFVLFSSASGIVSSPFIGAYAAANASLDALAQLRRSEGKPALSIDWGFWAEIGIAARQTEAAPRASHGMNALKPHQALRIFHRLLHTEATQVAVMPIDWSEWCRSHHEASRVPFLAAMVAGQGVAPAGKGSTGHGISRRALLDLPPAERTGFLAANLLNGVATALGADTSTLGVDQPLFELGLDSLMAVELKNQIETQLGISLPIAAFLKGGSIRQLAEQVVAGVAAGEEGGDPSGGAQPITRVERVEDATEELLAQIDQLSDHQARALLERGT